jgi:hypothetical protein
MVGLIKNVGNKINSVIKRNKYLDKLDAAIEVTFNKFTAPEICYSDRALRRYKTFLGNKLVTKGKVGLLKKSLPIDIPHSARIVDVGCADGSLLFELYALDTSFEIYGVDSGYQKCFENREMPNNINIRDMDLYHPYYSPSGKSDPETVNLRLPENTDLCIMYDVVPYLNSDTIENYFYQFSKSLNPEGFIFVTCKIETLGNHNIQGTKGEKYQFTSSLSDIAEVAARCGFEIIFLAWGNWDSSRKNTTIYGADIVVFKRRSH